MTDNTLCYNTTNAKFYTAVCFTSPSTQVGGNLVPADGNWCQTHPWITQHATAVVQMNIWTVAVGAAMLSTTTKPRVRMKYDNSTSTSKYVNQYMIQHWGISTLDPTGLNYFIENERRRRRKQPNIPIFELKIRFKKCHLFYASIFCPILSQKKAKNEVTMKTMPETMPVSSGFIAIILW